MSVYTTTNSLCRNLYSRYNGLISPVRMGKSTVQNGIREYISGLAGLAFQPRNDILDQLDEFNSTVNDYLPGVDYADMYTINNFLKNCLFLDGIQPVSVLNTGTDSIYDYIYDLLFGYGNEFYYGGILGRLLGLLFGNQNLSGILGQASGLFNCLDSLCGGSLITPDLYSDYVDEVNGYYDDMYLDDDGLLDYDLIYSESGISSYNRETMDIINDSVSTAKDNVATAVENSIAAVKQSTGSVFG